MRVQQVGSDPDIGVDSVAIRVFGAPDCDDANPAAFSPATLFPDSDGDGTGVSGQSACIGNVIPVGLAGRGGDCDAANASAFPGQSAFFTSARSNGSFDYNCDGAGTPQPLTSATACTLAASCQASNTTVPGACGGNVDVGSCNGACLLVTTPTPQPCR